MANPVNSSASNLDALYIELGSLIRKEISLKDQVAHYVRLIRSSTDSPEREDYYADPFVRTNMLERIYKYFTPEMLVGQGVLRIKAELLRSSTKTELEHINDVKFLVLSSIVNSRGQLERILKIYKEVFPDSP